MRPFILIIGAVPRFLPDWVKESRLVEVWPIEDRRTNRGQFSRGIRVVLVSAKIHGKLVPALRKKAGQRRVIAGLNNGQLVSTVQALLDEHRRAHP